MGKEAEAAVVAPIIYGGNAMHVTQAQFTNFKKFFIYSFTQYMLHCMNFIELLVYTSE